MASVLLMSWLSIASNFYAKSLIPCSLNNTNKHYSHTHTHTNTRNHTYTNKCWWQLFFNIKKITFSIVFPIICFFHFIQFQINSKFPEVVVVLVVYGGYWLKQQNDRRQYIISCLVSYCCFSLSLSLSVFFSFFGFPYVVPRITRITWITSIWRTLHYTLL